MGSYRMFCSCSKSITRSNFQIPLTLYSMFFHLLYIHLFRPFLKYKPSTSPLPSHVSPRKVCIQAASAISKMMRLYKRTYGLRQICNIAVYIVHSACTIHLLNLPEADARRDIIHGFKNLEEIAEDWLCARRTLSIISVLARKWKSDLPEEATAVLARTDAKYGFFSTADVPSPKSDLLAQSPRSPTSPQANQDRASQILHPTHSQNPLMESLYSYVQPENSSGPSIDTHIYATASSKMLPQPAVSSSTSPYSGRPISLSDAYNMSTSTSRSASQQAPDSTTAPEEPPASTSATFTRRISPSTLFGGVEMLVESQDSWLRDQANLPVGFENWMGIGSAGQNAEFFMGESDRRSETRYTLEDTWPGYNLTD